jgi:hypothetical protein
VGIFRRQVWSYYDRRRYITTSAPVAVDVSVIGVSKVHPSRNPLLRQRGIEDWKYYQKRITYPSIFVTGIITVVSKVHPSRNIMLRDGTFRPPYLHYYQPRHAMAFTAQAVSAGLTEVLFKGMWRGMYRSMR